MKKTIASMFETGVLQLLCLVMLFVCAFAFAGCSVTKINYEKDEKGVVSYRLYRNSHWLKMEGEGMRGGMSGDGKFEFDLEGMKSSPSEEFNRTMQTYTTAFVQLAQIAAAAYNPSASASAANISRGDAETRSVASQSSTGNNATASQTSQQSQTSQPDCTDGSCTTGACTDGSCSYNGEVK